MQFSKIIYNLPKIFLLPLLVVGVERFCHKQTRGFNLLKIASESPKAEISEIDTWPFERKQALEASLNQRFFFLDSGGQSYAFLSQDGKTIIKFFKQHHLRNWKRLNALPLPKVLHKWKRTILKKNRHQSPLFLESCKIAYQDFSERTGLIYLHLNQTTCFKKKIEIVDRLGIVHYVDLDTTDFALQKKAELCHPKLRKLIFENNLDTAKECIDSLLELIIERFEKGIHDRDPNIRRNVGYIGTQAIEVDLGSFTYEQTLKNPQLLYKQLIDTTHKLQQWLFKEKPELSVYLANKLELLYRAYLEANSR